MRTIFCAATLFAGLAAPVAAADLGMGMLAYDQGDYPNALAEWVPLAESGDPTAQSLLAMMYRTGEGLDRDQAMAATLYMRAAHQGHPYAQYNAGEMLRNGEGIAQDLEAAYVWFALAAQQIPVGSDGSSAASRARDAVGANLSADRLAAAQQQLAEFVAASE